MDQPKRIFTTYPPLSLGDAHGQHWTAGPPIHGNPLQGADPGAGAITPFPSAPDSLAAQFAQLAQLAHSAYYRPAGAPAPPAIENAGIKTGEIIAWRAWRIQEGWLRSVIADAEWDPDEPLEAHGVSASWGVHAFKSRARAIRYGRPFGGPIAVGRVALWGDVIEFEQGWHAQFARVRSLDVIINAPKSLLEDVRETYGVAEGARKPIDGTSFGVRSGHEAALPSTCWMRALLMVALLLQIAISVAAWTGVFHLEPPAATPAAAAFRDVPL